MWLLGGFIGVLIWFLLSLIGQERIFASPISVFTSLFHNLPNHGKIVLQTGIEAFCGLLLASIVSFSILCIIGLIPFSKNLLYPNLIVLKASPAVAFVPLFVSLVGTGATSKALVAAMISFFPLIIGGIDGMSMVPEKFRAYLESVGARRVKTFFRIHIIYGFQGFLSGLKTAAPLSVVGAIVGEYVAGGRPTGVGHFIMTNYVQSQSINVYVGIVLSASLGVIFFAISSWIYNASHERFYLWR